MNDKYGFNSNGSNDNFKDNPEIRTNQNIEALNRLFDEADYGDDTLTDFSLSNQEKHDSALSLDEVKNNFTNSLDKSSDSKVDLVKEDPLEKTMEIKNVDLSELKELQAKLHEIYDEPKEEEKLSGGGANKGKSLVKATKQGIAFSNGSLTRTFLDCTILCFITASMGYGMFMYILMHI